MKIIIMCFIIISGFTLKAQDVREMVGDQALMFDMSSLDESLISNYNYGLGYRYYFANKWSLALSIGYNNSDRNETIDTIKTNYLTNFIGINPSVRYNFSSNKNIIAFIGADASYMIETNTVENENKSEEERNLMSGGLFVGADWFAFKNISFTAQYRLGYGVSSFNNKLNGNLIEESEENNLQLGMSEFKLGLSVFFN